MSARDELGARQASLVAALVAGAAVPAGVDAERVRIQALALLRKRGRGVARTAPELAAALGRSFGAAFGDYARGLPREGGSADDAAAFARYLLSSPYGRAREVRKAARHIILARLVRGVHRAKIPGRAAGIFARVGRGHPSRLHRQLRLLLSTPWRCRTTTDS